MISDIIEPIFDLVCSIMYKLACVYSEDSNQSVQLSGSQIRVRNGKLFFLFLNQNICCGYSKEPSH